MSDYAHERSSPTIPQCKRSSISVTFDGKHVTIKGRKPLIFPAVSGKRDPRLGFVYSVQRQTERSSGPIPSGEYWIDLDELWENAWYRRGSRAAWGNFRLTIHVLPGTNTYGRGGFFIHGGAVAGSAGCIDLTNQIDAFVNALREELSDAGKCFVPVTVRY